MQRTVERIFEQSPEDRQSFILDVFASWFGEQMTSNREAFNIKFRKMASSPLAFYRGSASLFYADLAADPDSFLTDQTSRVWIHGDLHAENFGTYMNSEGVLVFDINDFDEAYVGPYTWDIKRLAASLSIIGYQKALSDAEIGQLIETMARAYAAQVIRFARHPDENDYDFALTLDNTSGHMLDILHHARLRTRVGLLESNTYIERYERHFVLGDNVQAVDDATRRAVLEAFEGYLETIPKSKRRDYINYNVKDVVARSGVGIGSAGLRSYTLLVEGNTQALENDILLYMKQAQPAAPSRVITDKHIKDYFIHDGHRTVVSQRALQAHAAPWLGYALLDGVGQLVNEVSPYEMDLDWELINDFDEILRVVNYLGQATAKVHCVSDVDSDQTLVPFSTEEAICGVLEGREDEFVAEMVSFGEQYGAIVRDDHRLFVDAFRNYRIPGLH